MTALLTGYFAILVAGFFLGSIPWGILVSRGLYKTDIREHGSGNIGTTNAMRTLGKKAGALVFALDFAKGLAAGGIAVFVSAMLWPGQPLVPLVAPVHAGGPAVIDANALRALAFVACVLGHVYSPWLKFKGGKGIAVGVGCLFVGFGPLGASLELVVFGVLVAASRYVSVGSMVASASIPLFALWLMNGSLVGILLCLLAAIVLVWAHRENIKRLLAHEESRIGSKKKAEDGRPEAVAAKEVRTDAEQPEDDAEQPEDPGRAASPRPPLEQDSATVQETTGSAASLNAAQPASKEQSEDGRPEAVAADEAGEES